MAGSDDARGWTRLFVVGIGFLAVVLLGSASAEAAAPTINYFVADTDPSDPSLVTLRWSVSDGPSSNLVYVFPEVGFQPLDCSDVPDPGSPGGTDNWCSVSVRVDHGASHQFRLQARHGVAFVQEELRVDVPAPTPPRVTSGLRQVVDSSAAQGVSIDWTITGVDGVVQVRPPTGGWYDNPLLIEVDSCGPTGQPGACDPVVVGTVPVGVAGLAAGSNTWALRQCERTESWSATAPVSGTVAERIDGYPGRAVRAGTVLHRIDDDGDQNTPAIAVTAAATGTLTTFNGIGPGSVVNAGDELTTIATDFCSEQVLVEVWHGPDRFLGDHRHFIEPGQSTITLEWTDNAELWNIRSPTLGISEWSAVPTITFTDVSHPELFTVAASDPDGVMTNQFLLSSCRESAGPEPFLCTNAEWITVPDLPGLVPGATITELVGSPFFEVCGLVDPRCSELCVAGAPRCQTTTVLALVDHDDDPDTPPVEIPTPNHANLIAWLLEPGQTIGAGDLLALAVHDWSQLESVDRMEITTGQSPWSRQVVTDDYSLESWSTWDRPGTGVPLDITIATDGDLWSLGEFSTRIAKVDDATGTLTDLETPIRRNWDPEVGLYVPVLPYRTTLGNVSADFSQRGERIIETEPGSIWYTQGGGSNISVSGNHSRIVNFRDDPALDLPWTPHDERFCVVDVPGDNNEVVGLTWDGTRLWFAEMGVTNGHIPSISSFVPGEVPCGHLHDFDTGPPDDPPYCAAPGQTGCITHHRVDLVPNTFFPEVLEPAHSPAHLLFDAGGPASGDEVIWFTDWFKAEIGRFDITTATWESWRTSRADRQEFYLGSGVWQLRQTETHLYFNEYRDAQIVRVAKADLDTLDCQPVDGADNPCIEEVAVPQRSETERIHSIDIDDRSTPDPSDDRLWFTIANDRRATEFGDGSRLGWVPLATWDSGVVYDSFADLVTDPLGPRGQILHFDLTGLDVSEAHGTIAVNDLLTGHIIRLTETSP